LPYFGITSFGIGHVSVFLDQACYQKSTSIIDLFTLLLTLSVYSLSYTHIWAHPCSLATASTTQVSVDIPSFITTSQFFQ
jgi:hypothetical protein